MELPLLLRQNLSKALSQVALAELIKASESLSLRYRNEVRDERLHLEDNLSALAYLASRLPATYGAIRDSFKRLMAVYPSFTPETLLDVGSGPGSALWAAKDAWPTLKRANLIERSSAIRHYGERFANDLDLEMLEWHAVDLHGLLPDLPSFDLVSMAYVLNELDPDLHLSIASRLWDLTATVLIIVEPGTTAGWLRIVAIREHLLNQGAHMLAPCPHSLSCPLQTPDWCHFAARIPRSKLHRQAKQADLSYEDEKYLYLALSRKAPSLPEARILAPVQSRKGLIRFKLCNAQGRLEERSLSKRDGNSYSKAKRLDWGDSIEIEEE